MSGPIVLEARGLSLAYDGKPVLQDVSLVLHAGERLGVIGRSGSGKTALARLLAGLPPSGGMATGTLAWPCTPGRDRPGQDERISLATLTPAARRRSSGRLGWLPQEAHAALHAQLRLGRQLAETLRAAGQAAGQEALAAGFRGVGLDPVLLGRYPHQVSGGQAQRAALACVLAQSPAVLVADEPTSALDAETAAAILDLLMESSERHRFGLVLVTHDLQAAARCGRLLVLDGGCVVEAGVTEDILGHPESEAALCLVQASARLRAPC